MEVNLPPLEVVSEVLGQYSTLSTLAQLLRGDIKDAIERGLVAFGEGSVSAESAKTSEDQVLDDIVGGGRALLKVRFEGTEQKVILQFTDAAFEPDVKHLGDQGRQDGVLIGEFDGIVVAVRVIAFGELYVGGGDDDG